MSDHPARKCNGGRTGTWCGRDATVVCTSTREDEGPRRFDNMLEVWPGLDVSGIGPLEWFACDNPAHQTDAKTTPIAEWFARNVPA